MQWSKGSHVTHRGRRRSWDVALMLATAGACTVVATLLAPGAMAGALPAHSHSTVWLCQPKKAGDPCASNLTTTVVTASGSQIVQAVQPAAKTAFDCFYVYPTVSTQKSANANLQIQPAEIGVAMQQASPFSQVCRVWAPMYRQRTSASLVGGLGSNPQADNVAYKSLLAGFRDYMAHENDGRPIVFIGHSQGAAMLIRLIHNVIDPSPKLRSRLVSAIILGGNVQVPKGRLVGGSFAHVPACTSPVETGCVIAYSTFPGLPPANTNFGRPGIGVSLQSDQDTKTGQTVLCTNPADLRGGTAPLLPSFLTAVSGAPPGSIRTPWVSYPNLYTASCMSSDGASWLQVTADSSVGDRRPRVTEVLGPTWGYHLDDVNLALGNLIVDVRQEEQAFSAHHHG